MLSKLKLNAEKLKKEIFALYLAYKRKETPFIAKAIAIIIVAYALSPIDLIPDFIPVLGYIDDLILLPLAITLVIKLIPIKIMEQCRKEAEVKLKGKIPEAKIAGIIIASFWLILIIFLLYKISSGLLIVL